MTKLSNNKGFTLVELLIVIAIIAILAAVALPVYTAQIENARESVDSGTVRSAASLAQSDYLLSGLTTDQVYDVYTSKTGDTVNVYVTLSGVSPNATDHTWYDSSMTYEIYVPVAAVNATKSINLEIGNGGQILASDFT